MDICYTELDGLVLPVLIFPPDDDSSNGLLAR
jgi:hypothetical protein